MMSDASNPSKLHNNYTIPSLPNFDSNLTTLANLASESPPEESNTPPSSKINHVKDSIVTDDIISSDINSSTFDEIELTTTPVNPVKKVKKGLPSSSVKCTILKAICSHSICNISVDLLRKFASKNSIPSLRSANRETIIEKIIEYKKKYELANLNGTVDEFYESIGNASSIVNKIRLINVVFGDVCRPMFARERAFSLKKDELTQGLGSDEKLYRSFFDEYNNKFASDYSRNAFSCVTISAKNHPSKFEQIHPDNWMKAKTAFNEVLKDYEVAFINWKHSGTHTDMHNVITKLPFENFGKTCILRYFHEHIKNYKDLFQSFTGKNQKKFTFSYLNHIVLIHFLFFIGQLPGDALKEVGGLVDVRGSSESRSRPSISVSDDESETEKVSARKKPKRFKKQTSKTSKQNTGNSLQAAADSTVKKITSWSLLLQNRPLLNPSKTF